MANWRNKVSIKDCFSENTDDKTVLNVSKVVKTQLVKVLNTEISWIDKNKNKNLLNTELFDDIYNCTDELEDVVIGSLDTIITGISEGYSSGEFGYNDWCDMFNDTLNSLYDIGDTLVGSGFNKSKFMWIG